MKEIIYNENVSQTSNTLIKRIGIWGFTFFLVKGLAWLIGPMLLVWFGIK